MYSSPSRVLSLAATLFITLSSAALIAQEPVAHSTTQSTAAYGNCPSPSTPGVHVCWPSPSGGSAIQSPMQVIASATGGDGSVSRIELWSDGKKIGQASGNLFDQAVNISSGTHRITLVEVDSVGAYVKSTPFTIDIQGSTLDNQCAAPSSPGVNVCYPAVGSCHTAGWTTVVAAGTGASGTVARMELWVNGVKLANFAGNAINTNLYLPDFDKLTIVEVDSKGAYVKSATTTLLSC